MVGEDPPQFVEPGHLHLHGGGLGERGRAALREPAYKGLIIRPGASVHWPFQAVSVGVSTQMHAG